MIMKRTNLHSVRILIHKVKDSTICKYCIRSKWDYSNESLFYKLTNNIMIRNTLESKWVAMMNGTNN